MSTWEWSQGCRVPLPRVSALPGERLTRTLPLHSGECRELNCLVLSLLPEAMRNWSLLLAESPASPAEASACFLQARGMRVSRRVACVLAQLSCVNVNCFTTKGGPFADVR